MDKEILKKEYERALKEVIKEKSYRLNFGVYYTPMF